MLGSGAPAWVEVLAALSPFMLAALAGVGWLYRHERERRSEVERQLSEHKYRAYIEVLDIFFDAFKAQRTNRLRAPDNRAVERMIDANKELMIYGSDNVAMTYAEWLAKARANESVTPAMLRDFGEIVVAIRRDMGNPKTRMTADDVLRQLVTDYDEAMAELERVDTK